MATQISEDQVSVTTFDSAGGDTAFKNTAQYAGYSRSTQEQNTLFEGHNVTFDSRPNAINQCDYKTEITKYTVHNAKHGAYNPNSWSLSNILAKLNPIQLIKEHSLDNFIKVFEGEGCIVGQDNVPVTYNHTTTKTPVAFDEDLFAKIIPSPNAEYTMTKFDQVNNEHITIEFSKDALNDAYRLGNNDITNFLEEVAIAGNYHTLSDIASAA